MDQEVTIRYLGCMCMSIGNAHYTDRRLALRQLEWCSTEGKKNDVKALNDGAQWGE
jgi:hypothetical protein